MSHQVLARQWRPQNFEQLIGQHATRQALSNALTQNRLHHAYLFTGTRGVGKTTIGRILAKCLNCEQGITATPCGECDSCRSIVAGNFVDLIEIDAASRTKVEDTRELLDNVQYAPTRGRFKIYLIDEVHMLSKHSFNALLKTLEEPPEHVKFLLATTDPQKLPVTILSRCLQFHLRNMLPDDIVAHLKTILTSENIPFEEAALWPLADAAKGSMRDALSLLDQAIAYGDNHVSQQSVNAMLGSAGQSQLCDLLSALAAHNAPAIIDSIQTLASHGVDFTQTLDELLSLLHQMALYQLVPTALAHPEQHTDLITLADQISREDIQLYYQMALVGRRDLSLAPSPKQGFEMLLLRMLAFSPAKAPTTPPPQTKKKEKSVATTEKTASATTSTPIATSDTPSATNEQWPEIVSALNLQGLTQVLAAHCVLVKQEDSAVTLQLNPQHSPLLNDQQKKHIQTALSNYFQKEIQLSIIIEETATLSPAAIKQKKQTAELEAANSAITSDPQIKQIIDQFNATIAPDSIKAR